jgi:hypothetical protein
MKTIWNTTAYMLAALMLLSISCSDFGDINVDPNRSTSVATSTLLTGAMRSIGSVVGRENENLYAQFMSETQYTEDSRYQTINYNFNGWYTGPLAKLDHIIELNTNEETKLEVLGSGSNANQIAVARILKAYFFHFLTDRWGPLPYSQALSGGEEGGTFTPSYDSQKDIYYALFDELDAAVNQIDGGAGVSGDFFFNGDMDGWKRFANSLRMVMAIRIADADGTKAQSEYAAALAGGVVSSDAESIMYPFLPEANNQNPWFANFITRTDYAISSTLVDYMKPKNDPRLENFADPAPNHGDVQGMPYGIANAGDIPNADVSFPHISYVRGQDAPIGVITYAQILFCQAEAAVRGWTADNAADHYEAGIRASMAQWGVTDETAINDYIGHADVAYDAAKGWEMIMTQKWVALYLQGIEAWSEWRRSGYPALTPAVDALSADGQIPRRHGYPTTERDLNEANYDAAVANLLGGADDLSTKLWWDVN